MSITWAADGGGAMGAGYWSARRRFGLRPQCQADEREELLASHSCEASSSISSPLKEPYGDLMTKMMMGEML